MEQTAKSQKPASQDTSMKSYPNFGTKFINGRFFFGPLLDSSSKKYRKIKLYRKAILSKPRANIRKLEQLQRRCGLNLIYTENGIYLNQLLLHTLTKIYICLIPNYRIQERGESTSGQVSVKTQSLWKYENRLLKNYEEHLGFIEKILDLFVDPEALDKLLPCVDQQDLFHVLVLSAACSAMHLLAEHHDFNHRSRLIELSIKIMCTDRLGKRQKKEISKYQIPLLFNDVTAESVCEMITGLCKKIVDMKFRVPTDAIIYFKFLNKHMSIKASDLLLWLPKKRAVGLPDQCRKRKFRRENPETLEEVRSKYRKKINQQIADLCKTFWALMHENDQHDVWLAWYQPFFSKIVVQIFLKMTDLRNKQLNVFWINTFNTALENESFISKLTFTDQLTFLRTFNQWMLSAPKKYLALVNFEVVSENVYKFSNIIFNTTFKNEEWALFFQCLTHWVANAIRKREHKKYAIKFFRNMVKNFLTIPRNFCLAKMFSLLSWISFNQIILEEPWTSYYLIENDADSDDPKNMTAAQELRQRRAHSLIDDLADRFPNGYFRYAMWVCFIKTSEEDFFNQMLADEFRVDMVKLQLLATLLEDPGEIHRFIVYTSGYFA